MQLIPDEYLAGWRGYGFALVGVMVSVALASIFRVVLPHANLSLVFLFGVLAVAVRAGTGPALTASVLSFLAFNYLFIQPYYTFEVHDDGDVATLGFFLLIAAVGGHLAARIQAEMRRNREMIDSLTDLNRFTRRLAAAPDRQAVHRALQEQLERNLHGDARRGATRSAGETLSGQARQRLAAAFEDPSLALPELDQLDASEQELTRTLCELATVAAERIGLVADLERARVTSETEQLRSALLSSVSHDLRTPLASIIGSASSLLEYGGSFSATDRQELLRNVLDEAERLNRYIQNLLDMTRLGGGELQPKCDWVDIGDIISAAVERQGAKLAQRELRIALDPKIPLIYVQGVLIEQCLVNILDNAVSHTAAGGRVDIAVDRVPDGLQIDVIDDGPGIAEADRERVFDMFYTAQHADRRPGTGLGLAICRGLAGAHGGTVVALGAPGGRGACIRIWLPEAAGQRAA